MIWLYLNLCWFVTFYSETVTTVIIALGIIVF